MALQLTFTDGDTGIVYENSYHYIGKYGFDLDAAEAYFYVAVYKDAAARLDSKASIWLHGLNRFKFVASGADFLNHFQLNMIENGEPRSLCYNYLKNVNPQPDLFNYENATDV